MHNYIKEYNYGDDNLKFIFKTSEDVGFDFDIIIDGVSELEHGFEDQDELTIYASNIDITIDDISTVNYVRFKTLLAQYNKQYPYNFNDVLTLTIIKNNSTIFTGILYSVEYEIKPGGSISEYIKLTWTSASERLKDITFGNPAVLNELWNAGFMHRIPIYGGGIFYGYAYGWESGFVDDQFKRLILGRAVAGGSNTSFNNLINSLYRLINPYIHVTMNHDWLFGNNNYHITQLHIFGLHAHIFGRYFVKLESSPLITGLGNSNIWERHQDALVNGELYSCYYYREGNEGVPDRKVNNALKYLARNFGCITGMTSIDAAYFNKRFYPLSTAINLSNILSLRKETFLKRVILVKIYDDFTQEISVRGNDIYGLDEEDKLEYHIKLSSYNYGNISGYNLMDVNGNGIYGVTDPVINYSGSLSQVLGELEWRTRNKHRDKYTVEVLYEDIVFNNIYKINDQGYWRYFRPMKLSQDIITGKSIIEGIELY